VSRVLDYLLRCVAILFGYAAASLAASAFLHLIVVAHFGPATEAEPALTAGPFLFSIPFVALFVAYFAFLPAAVAILISEVLARRDWLFHALAGGIVAAIVLGFLHEAVDPGLEITGAMPMLTVLGSGIVGGFVYWLCAGRGAGAWQALPTTREPTAPGR
jgi:hypothetical protein